MITLCHTNTNKTLTLVSSYSKGVFPLPSQSATGEETRCSNERFTLTPEPPSVNLSALPPPDASKQDGSPFPLKTCKLNHRFRNCYSVFSFFGYDVHACCFRHVGQNFKCPNHSFTRGLKRLSGNCLRCAQFGVSAVFRRLLPRSNSFP